MQTCRASFVALALACACAPEPPTGSASEPGDAAESTSTGGGAGSASTTRGADPTSTTASPMTTTTTSVTTSTTLDEPSTTEAPAACDDGVAEPGEVCLALVDIDVIDHQDGAALADMDEDGHLDLVTIYTIPQLGFDGHALALEESDFFLEIALGDGAGGFTSVLELNPLLAGYSVGVGEFTGDRHLDVVVLGGDFVAFAAFVFPGDGTGGLGEPIASSVPARAGQIALGDLDGDGALDLVGSTPGGPLALFGDGAGGFVATPVVEDEHEFAAPVLHDLDRDGDLDLLILRRYPGPHSLEVFLGAGDGTFAAVQPVALKGAALDVAVVDPAVGERAAVVVTSYEFMHGRRIESLDVADDGSLGPRTAIPGATGKDLAVGRFDGGPRPDFLALDGPAAEAFVGGEPWPPPAIALFEAELSIQSRPAVGDLNEDGVDDVVFGFTVQALLSRP